MTKKKSIWALALTFMLFVPAMLLFSACGGDKHLISKDWSKNESQHWHACTGKNCDEKYDLAEHEFVWTEKTPAGFHVDKVEEGTCSTCNFKIDRQVPNTATHTYETESWEKDKTGHGHKSTCDETDPTHQGLKNDFAEHTYGAWAVKTPAEFHKNRVDHRLCSVCGFEDTKEVLDTMEHTWGEEYVYNDKEYHWEETICSGHDKIIRNKEKHTTKWHILNNQQHQLVTDCKEHGLYSIKTENHRYDNVDDTTCNDCGYVRSLAGKGSFNAVSAKTYNAGAQGVASSDYTVNEAIKDLCEIQYKVKGANDSTYTTTAPTNAGTYEVRIFCRGNSTYLKGEVAKAKTDYVINKYKVEIAKNLNFKVAYNKTAMEDANVQYIHLGTVNVSEGLVNPVDVPIKVLKKDSNKNPGRNQVYVEDLLTENDNFAIKELPSSDALRRVNLVHYNDNVVATLTSVAEENKVKWDETTEQVGITVTRVNNGTIRVGDYMICEGYSRPLEVVALKLQYNVPTDMLVNADRNCEIYFDYSSFADLDTAKPILANKTFTEVETLNFEEGKNYTNTVSRQLNKGEKFYLAFTTEASANLKTYKLNFNTNGTGYVTTSDSVVFYREDGSGVSGGYELNVITPDGVLYFVTVTKTADSDLGKESVDFYISKS